LAVVTGNVDDIRTRRSNRSQLTLVVAIALGVRLLVHDLTAKLGKGCFEELCQSTTIRRVEVEHDRRFFSFERIRRKLGHHLTLERVDKANAEDVISNLSNGRVRRRR